MDKKTGDGPEGPLEQFLERADARTLAQLVRHLAATRPEVRRECSEFLSRHGGLTSGALTGVDSGPPLALWQALEPDLSHLRQHGEQDATWRRVGQLLGQLITRLRQACPSPAERQALRDRVVPYLGHGNAGMEDALYDVAYAACQDAGDWRALAGQLEALGQDGPLDHARRLYRRLGDRDRYLALRYRRLVYGGDYHDLAAFHWEQGEHDQALAVAQEGLRKGKGRLDELRAFLAERARESGDRKGYLELRLVQTTAPLTLDSYRAFQKLCSEVEWAAWEPRLLAALEGVRGAERLRIHLERGEEDQAARLLSGMGYPDSPDVSGNLLQIAARLEPKYPEQALAFYLTGLGDCKQTATRAVYAHQAQAACKVRYLWVDVLRLPEKWEAFARPLKLANKNRPAFQKEFTRAVPGWKTL